MNDAFKLSRAALDDDEVRELSPLCRVDHRRHASGHEAAIISRCRHDQRSQSRIAKLEAASKRKEIDGDSEQERFRKLPLKRSATFVGKELDPILQAHRETGSAIFWREVGRCLA